MLLANEVSGVAPSNASLAFSHEDAALCLSIAKQNYPTHQIALHQQQGGCSLTLSAVSTRGHDDDIIVQFRLPRFALSPTIVHESQAIYGSLVPAPLWFEDVVASHGAQLQVCAMTSIAGNRFSELQPKERHLDYLAVEKMRVLMAGMARFFAIGWEKGSMGKAMNGKVGKSLVQRLRQLEKELPREWMRHEAGLAADAVECGVLECLPIVLNHGDLLPSNIMVHDESWELSGLVDWAEAENLPFGMPLYGIEHLLGFQEQVLNGARCHRFTYYDQADTLRGMFWSALLNYVPALADLRFQTSMLLSRKIGVLLWHGFAWDDGKIDRVINELKDLQEMAYLEALLDRMTDSERSRL